MNKKGIITKIVGSLFAISLIIAADSYVKAANDSLTPSSLYFDETVGDYEDTTPSRYKSDYSSGYVYYITSSENTSTTFCMVASTADASDIYYDDFTLVYYNLNVGNGTKMINYVKESGYNYAAVRGSSNYYGPYNITIRWSPDTTS